LYRNHNEVGIPHMIGQFVELILYPPGVSKEE
jgi:hypothetical protein